MKRGLGILFLVIYTLLLHAQNPAVRPSVGITLSGGGAKGLAHIGILKAIDSAGLKVNYVTGTSMGSIIGALYASGYSADTIEKMARKMDWDMLLSNNSTLRPFIMQEKEDYSSYAVELPWVNHAFRLPSGVLESEELWLKISEFFFPVYYIKSFSQLPIGFKCIATDVSTGEAVVFDSGQIVYAIRSSMAIPSNFTAVDYNGRKLVDGGIVRNFPVIDAKKMGADIVIGSNVNGGLLPKEKINNIFNVLLQIAFFREDADAKIEKQLCNIFIPHQLDEYTMASFSSSGEIIDEGIRKGRELYPRFKKLADSLDAIYGLSSRQKVVLPEAKAVKITSYEINGLNKTNPNFFLQRMQFRLNQYYTAVDLSEHIRKAFGTRYYNKIIYSLIRQSDGTAKIIFDVEENPFTFAKLGINYNQFTGISLIGNLTSRNFLFPYSKSQVTVNLGENLRLRGEHIQFFGKLKTLSLTATTQLESVNINSYANFSKQGEFRQGYFSGDLNIRFSPSRQLSFGLGTRFENLHYTTQIPARLELHGGIGFLSSYLFFQTNSLSNAIYPRKGDKTNIEVGYIYGQDQNMNYYEAGNIINNLDSLGIGYNNYPYIKLNSERYVPLSRRSTFFTQIQGGINLKGRNNIINSFTVGGLTNVYRNQITFAGLNEGTVLTNSIAAMQMGFRYQLYNNTFLTGKINGAFYDFIDKDFKPGMSKFLSGYSLSFGYNFILGPLEISAMYCDQSKTISPYINLGIPF
jgi:NTE family protein